MSGSWKLELPKTPGWYWGRGAAGMPYPIRVDNQEAGLDPTLLSGFEFWSEPLVPPPVPRLSGRALQETLLHAGVALCPICKGDGEVPDTETDGTMGCLRCKGSGRFFVIGAAK